MIVDTCKMGTRFVGETPSIDYRGELQSTISFGRRLVQRKVIKNIRTWFGGM